MEDLYTLDVTPLFSEFVSTAKYCYRTTKRKRIGTAKVLLI